MKTGEWERFFNPFRELLGSYRDTKYEDSSELLDFWSFVHRPVFWKLESTTFRKLDLIPSTGEGGDIYPVEFLEYRTMDKVPKTQ
jgi:hypothetical protein